MSIFIFTIIVGSFAALLFKAGMTYEFFGIILIGIAAQAISEYYNKIEQTGIVQQNIDNFNENMKKLNDARQKQLQELNEKANKYNFLEKNQIPVKINKDTNTYVVDAADIIKAIDKVYTEMETNKEDINR